MEKCFIFSKLLLHIIPSFHAFVVCELKFQFNAFSICFFFLLFYEKFFFFNYRASMLSGRSDVESSWKIQLNSPNVKELYNIRTTPA